jgi:hypothetical protein
MRRIRPIYGLLTVGSAASRPVVVGRNWFSACGAYPADLRIPSHRDIKMDFKSSISSEIQDFAIIDMRLYVWCSSSRPRSTRSASKKLTASVPAFLLCCRPSLTSSFGCESMTVMNCPSFN